MVTILSAQTDCDCPDPQPEDEVCVEFDFGDGNTDVFPFPSACWAACEGLTVVDGECDFDGGDFPDGGEWEDCDCPEPGPEDEICVEVDFGDGNTEVFPCPSACLAECYGYTVVDGECEWESDFPDGGEWEDCDCPEPTEEDMVCVEFDWGDGEIEVFPYPSACWAACDGLAVVDGECDYEWDGGTTFPDGEWEDCDCPEPTEDDLVCVQHECDGEIIISEFPSACIAACFELEIVDCDNVDGPGSNNLAVQDHRSTIKSGDLPNYGNNLTISMGTPSMVRNAKLAPNPVHTNTSLSLEIANGGTFELRLMNIEGRILQTNQVQFVKGFNQFNLNVSDLESGIHFVQIISPNHVETIRFLKM